MISHQLPDLSYRLSAACYQPEAGNASLVDPSNPPAGSGKLEAGSSDSIPSRIPSLLPGQVGSLTGDPGLGMTRLGLAMLSDYAGAVAYLDVRGWLSPLAAWEVGIEPDRLVIARCGEVIRWGKAAAALLDGATAVLAEVPAGAKDASIRKLAALARNRGTTLLLRPLERAMPTGVAHLVLEASEAEWSGTTQGHGRINRRRTLLTASGKAMRGMTRTIEMEDDGSNTLRVVPGVAAEEIRSVAG